jgi:NAD+ kinase
VYSDNLIKYHLEIDGVDAGYHRANGVVVGTPTGSTAYTLSNGGGLILPSMNVMQIVPISPLSMSSRPIIVPGDSVVRITVETEGTWILKGDGNRMCEFTSDHPSPSIDITQSNHKARILHTKDWNFFEMLSNKLHWKKL